MRRSAFLASLWLLCGLAGALLAPAARAQLAYGVSATGELVRFDISRAATIISSVPITGLGAGESILGIDFRLDQLYGLGSQSRLYRIDPATGLATQVGSDGAFTLEGTTFGFDHYTREDRGRMFTIVSDTGRVLEIDRETGAQLNSFTIAASVAGLAYPPSPGACSCITWGPYAIDATSDTFLSLSGPSLFPASARTLGVDASAVVGLDIWGYYEAYAVMKVGGTTGLYRIDLASGPATLVGTFPYAITAFALAPPLPSRLGNISTRMQVLTGSDVLIGGFVIDGAEPKTVVVRARGPSLASSGVANTLADPMLQLIRSADQSQIAFNNDWHSAPNAADLVFSGFAPSDPLESAILATLPPGAYTAIVSGAGNGTGIGIVEVFEADNLPAFLTNVSTRGQVLTGDDVMIGGFAIAGTESRDVVVRARGPSLAQFGIANVLADPQLQVFRASDQVQVGYSNNWQNEGSSSILMQRGFAPEHPLEAAVHLTLQPGLYTAIVTGVGGGTGVGIVEVFSLPSPFPIPAQ